jgi:peptidoglycan hydrolase-like protein with peptidoglycan-binding domain
VARVSYLRPAIGSDRPAPKARRTTAQSGRYGRGRFLAGGAFLLLVIAAVVGGGVLLARSQQGSLSTDNTAIARLSMPLGGGTVQRVSVVTGPHSTPVPVDLRGDQIWPRHLVRVHTQLQVEVVISRPGWLSWATGKTERLHLTVMTPSSSLRASYLTVRAGAPIVIGFHQPVAVVAYGPPGHLVRQVLSSPQAEIRVHQTATAGTIAVAAVPRTWESAPASMVSWFPAGAAATAVASPAPGTTIGPHTNITLTFSKPIHSALGSSLPPVSPTTQGTWHVVGNHTMVFQPEGYGYGLGAKVAIGLPGGVRLVGGQVSGSSSTGNWTVPPGSTLRLQQILANLGYLPLQFNGPSVALNPVAQESAAVAPPSGNFTWKYSNVPSSLRGFWAPGVSGTMTRGAVMAFENDHGITPDGDAGPVVWRSLINAAVANRQSAFGYTYVSVSLSGQHLDLWHNGHTVMTTAVNTGIAQAPTAPGTYPVYEHLRVTTMSGTNPDGSHYNDPGIQFVSYFNGGDALHAFTRAQYGFPQSLGCVEMALSPAGQVWPYTPIGTLVHVA